MGVRHLISSACAAVYGFPSSSRHAKHSHLRIYMHACSSFHVPSDLTCTTCSLHAEHHYYLSHVLTPTSLILTLSVTISKGGLGMRLPPFPSCPPHVQSMCHTVGTRQCNRHHCQNGYQGDFYEICDSNNMRLSMIGHKMCVSLTLFSLTHP